MQFTAHAICLGDFESSMKVDDREEIINDSNQLYWGGVVNFMSVQ